VQGAKVDLNAFDVGSKVAIQGPDHWSGRNIPNGTRESRRRWKRLNVLLLVSDPSGGRRATYELLATIPSGLCGPEKGPGLPDRDELASTYIVVFHVMSMSLSMSLYTILSCISFFLLFCQALAGLVQGHPSGIIAYDKQSGARLLRLRQAPSGSVRLPLPLGPACSCSPHSPFPFPI
jgi:hypothetical protein